MARAKLIPMALLFSLLQISFAVGAEETTPEKIETQKNEMQDGVKKTVRGSKDQVCKLVHGQMECLEKKVVHESKNLGDKIKTKANEIKNKEN